MIAHSAVKIDDRADVESEGGWSEDRPDRTPGFRALGPPGLPREDPCPSWSSGWVRATQSVKASLTALLQNTEGLCRVPRPRSGI